ncbi:MAG TPA: histidine kinase [Myxococcaceae bacterium]
MGWVGYVIAWVVAALFWALAASWGSHRPPRETLLYGFLAMGTAGLMGVGVWALSGRLEWNWRSRRFLGLHALALAGFAAVYATSWTWPDIVTGRGAAAVASFRSSPILVWNLLMGTWLYLVVAGFSYAIRAQRRARMVEAAAAEARVMAQQAQLAALRARLNPHFLYNALHSVGALVGRDPRRADDALERLGDLLRYVLDAEEEVPFRREWAFIQDYLAFEQLRLGERLGVESELDPAAASVLAPPLVLQPLVENAVRHGLADRPEGGRITLRARIEGKQLVLTVDDDGAGAPAGEGTGIGVSSVRERLRVIYGDAASVEAGPRARGFGVTLRLPVRRAGEELAA